MIRSHCDVHDVQERVVGSQSEIGRIGKEEGALSLMRAIEAELPAAQA